MSDYAFLHTLRRPLVQSAQPKAEASGHGVRGSPSLFQPIMVAACIAGANALVFSGLFAQRSPGLVFDRPEVIMPDHEFGSLDGVAIASDGTIYVIDALNYEVLRLSRAGEYDWRHGGKGSGPGEYRTLYRMAARPKGGVLVFDWGLNRVTLLSESGALDGIQRLPFAFSQVESVKELEDGRIVVAGMTQWGGLAAGHSIHVFSDSLRHLYSFGELAEAKDPRVVQAVGSGGFTIDAAGTILQTLKRPYEIHRYDPDGKRLHRIVLPVSFSLGLDDMIEFKSFEGRTFKSITPNTNEVELPLQAVALPGGLFLGGRRRPWKPVLDLFTRDGRILQTIAAPAGIVAVLAIDPDRGYLYGQIDRQHEPVLVRVRYVIQNPGG